MIVNGFIFTAGLFIGSFLNVVVYRLPRGESVVRPPSRCPGCGRRLTTLELAPVFSYLWLRGRCRRCGSTISLRYPLVELATGLIFLAVAVRFGLTLAAAGYAFFFSLLLAVSLIDLEHQRIPNTLVAAGLFGGAAVHLTGLFGVWAGSAEVLAPPRPWGDALLGFLVGGGLLLAICLVSRGGMGAGDFKLAALIGFFTGLKGIAVVLLLGFSAGALIGLALILLKKRGRKDPLPFAPFLSLAALAAVFWGETWWAWYLALIYF